MYIKEGFEVTMNARYFLNVSQSLYIFSQSFPNKKQSVTTEEKCTPAVEEKRAPVPEDKKKI